MRKKKTKQLITTSPQVLQNLIVRQARIQSADINTWRSAVNAAKYGERNRLYDLYENLLVDPFLSNALDKRVNAITNAELTFIKNGEAVEAIDDLIDTPEFEELLKEIIKSKAWGKSVIETRYSPDFNVFSYPRKHIRIRNIDKKLSERKKYIAAKETDLEGYDYTIDHHFIECGGDDDLGFLFKAAPYVIYKRGGFGDWAQFVEVFGMPFVVGKYNSYDTETRDKLFEALQSIGSNPVAAIPNESDVEIHDNKSSGSSGLYKDFRSACNEEILIAVLGNTMTTINGGSRAQGTVHKETEEDVNQSDRRYVQRILNRKLLPILIERGYKVVGGAFIFPDAGENISTKERIEMALTLKNAGVEVSDDYLYEISGIPKPDKQEKEDSKKEESKKEKEDLIEKTDFNQMSEETSEELFQSLLKTPNEILNEKKSFLKRLSSFFVNAPILWSGAIKNFIRNSISFITQTINLADANEDDYNIDINKLLNKALNEIYKNKEQPIVNKHLFDITNKPLQDGIDQEIKKFGLEFGQKNEKFIHQLKYNTAVFAAFKNHQQTNEMVALLTDDKGHLRSFVDFKKQALTLSASYNQQWLRTEYNTAVRAARAAANWKKFQEAKDLYPNLEYTMSRAAHKREAHLDFVGTILPIDHEWWQTHCPPLDWNCLCGIKQTDKPVTEVPTGTDVDSIFRNNPGITAEFINVKETPYYKHTKDKEAVLKTANELFAESLRQQAKYIRKTYKSGGWIETPVDYKQNKQEEAKNLEVYSLLAKNYGAQYRLLPVVNVKNIKNPDAITSANTLSDAKITTTTNIKNAIQRSINSASAQKVQEVVIQLNHPHTLRETIDGLKSALQERRAASIQEIVIIDVNNEVQRYNANKMRSFFKKNKQKPF